MVIEINNLKKSYGNKIAVNGITLQIQHGTILGLLGANGAGKSTLIECVLGTKKMDSGNVKILELDPIIDRKRLFEKVGVQFQDCAYQSLITVSELCEMTECVYKNPLPYKDLLSKFGLSDKIKAKVSSLSGGERQRLFIILALIPNPQVVFLDELTTGLDTLARKNVWKYLLELKGIALLSDKQRRLVHLRYYEEKTEYEIAEILNINQSNVHRQLKTIYSTLKKYLEKLL